ncbi:hypothetical protein D3C72_1549700 [compost metagenome]
MGKIEGRHDTAGEEVPGDPVCRIIVVKTVGSVTVVEDVQEEPAFRLQPGTNPLE